MLPATLYRASLFIDSLSSPCEASSDDESIIEYFNMMTFNDAFVVQTSRTANGANQFLLTCPERESPALPPAAFDLALTDPQLGSDVGSTGGNGGLGGSWGNGGAGSLGGMVAMGSRGSGCPTALAAGAGTVRFAAMSSATTSQEVAARAEMAAAVQRLGHALMGHQPTVELARRVTAAANELAAAAEQLPTRDRLSELTAADRPEDGPRLTMAVEVDLDGGLLDLFGDSVVSGRTNPLGIGLECRRYGDSVVGTALLRAAHEGAPGRAHGGIVAALIDETMGFVLSFTGELAYTANLSIDFVGPAPLHVPVRFTARVRDRAGRKLWIEATGEGPDGVFVRAEALFLAIDLERYRMQTES